MTTQLDLDDVAAQSKKAADELSDMRKQILILRDQIENAPIATSESVDFESMVWAFRITSECRVGSGVYALVRLTQEQLEK